MACEGKGDNSDIPQLHQPVHNLSIKTLLDIYSKHVKTNESKSDRENLDKVCTPHFNNHLNQLKTSI